VGAAKQHGAFERVIGLFLIRSNTLRFQQKGSDFFQELTARVAGVVTMRWKEHPFEWVNYERYAVVREYQGGSLKRFCMLKVNLYIDIYVSELNDNEGYLRLNLTLRGDLPSVEQ
jgi:hypothetical protein